MSLADRILQRLGSPVPEAATMQEWADWHVGVRTRHPAVYLLCVRGPRALRRLGVRLLHPFKCVSKAVRYRVMERYHVIPTALAPGYHEIEDRLLHGAFQLLVDYVEVELASIELHARGAHARGGRVPGRVAFRRHIRSADAGLAYLAWAAELRHEPEQETEVEARAGELTPQAHASRELRELYVWWTSTRPARPDPYAAGGGATQQVASDAAHASAPNDVQRESAANGTAHHPRTLDQRYAAEDTEMLVRLARIRQSLWS